MHPALRQALSPAHACPAPDPQKFCVRFPAVFFQDPVDEFLLVRVFHGPVRVLCHRIRMSLVKGDSPIKEQLEFHLHGMRARFHHYEPAFGHGFKLIRRHQRPFDHLQALRRIVLALAHGSRKHCPGPQSFR